MKEARISANGRQDGNAPPKAWIQGLLSALVVLLLHIIWQGSLLLTTGLASLRNQHDIAGFAIGVSFLVGGAIPYICFVRTFFWVRNTWPLPASFVWARCLGALLGGLLGILVSLYLIAHLGEAALLVAGFVLPPLLGCLGEGVAMRRIRALKCLGRRSTC